MNSKTTFKNGKPTEDEFMLFDESSFFTNFDKTEMQISTSPSKQNSSSMNNSSFLNVSALCCDEEISGFDKLTGKTWIYPTNYPVRDYQFNIIRATILKNTLVSLPTGLGKTFIAAVIMYNFYRWYPVGKIVFTAPTRPLVAQQIDACYNIVAIPPNVTVEMTGSMQVTTRKAHWKDKRVFFATPQVIYNDLKSGICPADRIRCLVFDEAHRARGNYAYCQIISTLTEMGHKTYRVLALSATPGSKVEDVVNVVKNLQIAHLELRTEACIDVAQYSHSKKINTVVIPLGDQLSHLRQQYVEILDYYARRLKQLNILPINLGNLSKGRIVMLYKEYQTKERGARHPQHNYIMKDFTLLIALFHGLELLVKHGSRVFLNFFDEHPEKSWIQSDDRLIALLERLRDDLGVNPLALDCSTMPDGTVPEIPKDICFGHPKFDRLRQIMLQHFNDSKQKGLETKAIVFCEYRESVNLVHRLLLQCRPLIAPQMFVGQGASGKDGKAVVSQKQQLRVMKSFRSGGCNVLVATCVAEEGLDVGSVDLIVCFDISTRSPVRLVQRCGRTGRERGGQVYILVTEGREHQTLMDCMRQRDNLNKRVLQSKEVEHSLYKLNPRMMPRDLVPECHKMYITVAQKIDPKEKTDKPKLQGQKDLRSMLKQTSSPGTSKHTTSDSLISNEDLMKLFPSGFTEKTYFKKPLEYWTLNKDALQEKALTIDETEISLTARLEWQRHLQQTVNVDHSSDTQLLSELLQYCDAKRFELPVSTQNPCFNTQVLNTQVLKLPTETKMKPPVKRKQKPFQAKSPSKKDGDIRALFSTATKSTKNYTRLISDLGIHNNGSISTALLDLIVDLNVETSKQDSLKCLICDNICDCSLLKIMKNKQNTSDQIGALLENPVLPDLNLLDKINADHFKRLDIKESENNLNVSPAFSDDMFIEHFVTSDQYLEDSKNKSELNVRVPHNNPNDKNSNNQHNGSQNFNLDFDFDLVEEDLENQLQEIEKSANSAENFDVGNIDDIFDDSNSPLEVGNSKDTTDKVDPKEALQFFGLDSIDDIFADSNDSLEVSHMSPETNTVKDAIVHEIQEISKAEHNFEQPQTSQKYAPLSPSLLSGTYHTNSFIATSPILCTQKRKLNLSTKKIIPNSSTPLVSDSISRKGLAKPKAFNFDLIYNKKDDGSEIQARTDEASEAHLLHKPVTALLSRNTTNNSENTGSKSMFTITQLVDMINKGLDSTVNSTVQHNTEINKDDHNEGMQNDNIASIHERSSSPIILTQAEKQRNASRRLLESSVNSCQANTRTSLVVLDSASDSDDTVDYNTSQYEGDSQKHTVHILEDCPQHHNPAGFIPVNSPELSKKNNKRKHISEDGELMALSPFFVKRPKVCNKEKKTLSLQNKLKSILNLNNKNGKMEPENHQKTNYVITSSASHLSQKENLVPDTYNNNKHSTDDFGAAYPSTSQKLTLEQLQTFRRGNKSTLSNILQNLDNKPSNKPKSCTKSQLKFDDSDDDFVTEPGLFAHLKLMSTSLLEVPTPIQKHRVKKKKKKDLSGFFELEADLSDASNQDSGDELSDESVGSIIDFICDEDAEGNVDMQAHYLRSVKSPTNGMFKIPNLPQVIREDVFSQADVQDDDCYEMDSFCVDSYIGLTQAHDLSELEKAEQILKHRRKAKKKRTQCASATSVCSNNNNETSVSPIVKVRRKNVKRRISSGSSSDSS